MKAEEVIIELMNHQQLQPIIFSMLACESPEWRAIPETQHLRDQLILLLSGQIDSKAFQSSLIGAMQKLDEFVHEDGFPQPEFFQNDWRGPLAWLCAISIAALGCVPRVKQTMGDAHTNIVRAVVSNTRRTVTDLDELLLAALTVYEGDPEVRKMVAPKNIKLSFVEATKT